MERIELTPRFLNGFWWLDKDKADAVMDKYEENIKELVDRCSSLTSQNETLESNYKEMTRDRDWCKKHIKELNKQLENAENAYYSLKMDMENRIKELEEELKEKH